MNQVLISSFSLACSALVANAQLYYVPIEIPITPEVSPVWLGSSFGADGNRLYIGGFGSSVPSRLSPGGVYEYEYDSLDYVNTIDPIGDPIEDSFAYSMEYYDGSLLVGAINAQSPGAGDAGAAYLINPISGALLHTFDEAANATPASEFGIDVSLNDVAIAIGAIGYGPSARGQVFVYNAVTNALITTLDPDPMTTDTFYGAQVEHNDSYFVVSAPANAVSAVEGAVYVYNFTTGDLLYRLTGPVPDTKGTGQFGKTIELLGNRLFVGSGINAPAGVRGSVLVYDLTTGNIITTLTGNTGDDADGFGAAISAEGSTLVIGAEYDDSTGVQAGAVYIFDLDTYQMIDKVLPPSPVSEHILFGMTVKIQDDKILTSSFDEDQFDGRVKRVFVLQAFCRPDINFDGNLNFLDVSAFLKSAIDFNEDGSFNFLDISAFLQSFAEGCP